MEAITLSEGWAAAPVSDAVAQRLRWEMLPDAPEPDDDQLLVRMKLIPIHPLDMLHCAGVLGGPPSAGCEGLGVIEKVGKSVKHFSAGQRVLVLAWPILGSPEGIFALHRRIPLWHEHVTCSAEHVLRIPEAVSDLDAAQAFLNPVSAYAMVRDVLCLDAAEWLILSGASSNLGRFVNAIGRLHGIRVLNLVRNPAQVKPLTEHGYAHVVAYDPADPRTAIEPILQRSEGGMHGGIDMVGGKVSGLMLDCLRPFKTLISVGSSSHRGADLSDLVTAGRLIMEGKRIEGFSVNKCWAASRTPERRLEVIQEVFSLFAARKLQGSPGTVFAFSDVRVAVERAGSDANSLAGKVFLSPSSSAHEYR